MGDGDGDHLDGDPPITIRGDAELGALSVQDPVEGVGEFAIQEGVTLFREARSSAFRYHVSASGKRPGDA